jgi:hypothetical protein
MATPGIPKWRLALVGGAMLLLAAVGLGAVNAGASPTSPANAPSAEAARVLASDAQGAPAQDAPALRPRRLGRALVHGTVTLDLPRKGLVTVQLDHGTIAAIDGTNLRISEAGNSSVTVATDDKTRVRKNGSKAKVSDLKVGDEVFVVSEVEGGSATAYRVVVPKAGR